MLREAGFTTLLSPFLRRLERGADLTTAEREALLSTVAADIREVSPHQDLVREGERPTRVHLVLRGFACRYKVLENGRRQIMAYLLPGDFCNLHVTILGHMDHSIATITSCTVAQMESGSLEELMARSRPIARSLWWASLVDEAVQREWLVNVGQRLADKRLAHLICELLLRLKAAGVVEGDSFEMPLTQQELGQSLGLSTVHVNRVLKELRASGLLRLNGKHLEVLDFGALSRRAQFNPNYLHLRDVVPRNAPPPGELRRMASAAR